MEEEKQKKEKTPRNRLAGVGKGGATTSELLDLKPKTKAKNKIKVDSIAEIDQALRDLELVEHGDVRKDGTTARANATAWLPDTRCWRLPPTA